MDTGSLGQSSTLQLIVAIWETAGTTFTEKATNYSKVIDAKLSQLEKNSREWNFTFRTLGLVQGLIKHDEDGRKQSIKLVPPASSTSTAA